MRLALLFLAELYAITDVTVIDPRSQRVGAHRTVVIEGTRIQSVRAGGKVPKGAQSIDGKGKFLIPGLWDAHVHLTKTGVLSLPLFVANGITGVRDLGSDFAEVSSWRKQIDAGTLVGPRIKTSGQILESRANVDRMKREATVEPVHRIRIGVANAAEGSAAVGRLADAGVDHIKMRTSPDVETFRAVVQEAKRRGLPVAAHPIGGPEEVARSGLRSVEHALSFESLDALADSGRRRLFRRMRNEGLYLSNTMVNLDGLFAIPYSEGMRIVQDRAGKVDPRRKYVCGYLIDDWREQVEESKDGAYDSLRKQMPGMLRDLRQMREESVQFLAGTDAGVVFMYPGFSMHDEMEKLVGDVGFTPMEVLQIGTDGVAGFYGARKSFGAPQPGQMADLVLLDADPLASIANTRRIAGVMAQGRWFDRAKLDEILQKVEQAAQSGCKQID